MFNPQDLSVLAYANNFTLWHYKTEDFNVLEVGYFNKAATMLNVNDLIISQSNRKMAEGKTTELLIVAKAENGELTITPIS